MDTFGSFKKYDYVLNDKKVLNAEKIFALIELWNRIGEFDFSEVDLTETVDIVDWALLHTMNTTLTAEWTHYMDLFEIQLLNSIERASKSLNKISKGFEKRFNKIIYVIENTWGIPVLEIILKTENVKMNRQIIEFFGTEQAHLISVRLIKLCESKCEDLALNLSTAFLKYLKMMKHVNRNVEITQDQICFIFDIWISLLYKSGDSKLFKTAIERLRCQDAIICVHRFLRKKPSLLKIWKCSHKIAKSIMHIWLEKLVIQNRIDHESQLTEILRLYTGMSTSRDFIEEVCSKIRKICESAEASMLLLFCDILTKLNNKELNLLIVEMFIKALTCDLNELQAEKEMQANFREKAGTNDNKVSLVTSRLAHTFDSLADFMEDKVKVARECALTAFSVEPTVVRLTTIESLAKKSGLPVLDPIEGWNCESHSTAYSIEDLLWECPECRKFLCSPSLNVPLKANLALYEAMQTLDLPETICEDLTICISNPRYQILSWYLPWTILSKLCLMYLKHPQKTRDYITELKYVKVDYSVYEKVEREPLDPYCGIEKGYEKYLDKNYNENDFEEQETLNENCAIEGEDYDPNSMESFKKILSIQSMQEYDQTDDEEIQALQQEIPEIEDSWTTDISANSCYTEDGSIEKDKISKGLKNLKRKFCFFSKDKTKNVPKTNRTIDENMEMCNLKIAKRSRYTLFGKRKSK